MARYQSGSLQLHTTDLNSGNAVNIGGVTDMQVDTGTETASDDSGNVYDETRSIVSQKPEAQLRLKSLASVLNYVGLAGYCISSDGSHPGVRLFGRVLNDCKSPPAATDNPRYTVGKGLVHLTSLSAQRGQDAEIGLAVHAITDGTNAPLAGVYSSVTLPTGLSVEQYTLGHARVGNITISDLASLQLDFGIQISGKDPDMGNVWPESVAVRKILPVLTMTCYNPTILDDSTGIPLAGKQATHAQTIIYLKKRANYSTFVADGTAQHIRITMGGILTVTQAFSGSGNGEATTVFRLEGVHDGSTVPVTFSTTSTYDSTP
jgi:hypothetical protein